MKTKYLICEGNNPTSKYYPGAPCHNKLEVSDNTVRVVCWRCLARLVTPPEEKKTQSSVGFPRGWQFMNQFVHADGKVYHKGIEQTELFGTLSPTEIKEHEPKRKKKETLDDKIQKEFYQKLKSKKNGRSKKNKK
jgi:hypothetical protein